MIDPPYPALAPQVDTILPGYGLCSMAIMGLQTHDGTPVVPKVDDCITRSSATVPTASARQFALVCATKRSTALVLWSIKCYRALGVFDNPIG
ncbi:MAG: DUF1638 domain-containing protein [Anaerolineae bacterium]|nr:DUF1638 domain-containing protein [Anaerolineae bacterium]